jgi:hypothetical protein
MALLKKSNVPSRNLSAGETLFLLLFCVAQIRNANRKHLAAKQHPVPGDNNQN